MDEFHASNDASESASNKLETALASGYNLDFSRYINEGFSLVFKDVWLFLGYLVVMAIISIGVSLIPMIGSVSNMFVSPALAIGFAAMADKIRYDGQTQFSDGFDGFKRNYGQLVLGSFLTTVILVAIIAIGIGFAFISNRDLIS